MIPEAARKIDQSLSKSLLTRISNPERAIDEKWADFDHLEAICERTGDVGILKNAVEYLASVLPNNDPRLVDALQSVDRLIMTSQSAVPSPAESTSSSGWVSFGKSGPLSEGEKRTIEAHHNAEQVWPIPFPYAEAWRDLGANELSKTIDDILSADPSSENELFGRLLKNCIAGRDSQLQCHQDVRVVELLIKPEQGLERTGVFLIRPDGYVRLNGTSPSIHKINAHSRPDFSTEQLAIQYLHFFCAMVHGEEGAFHVISEPSVLLERWASSDSPDEVLDQLGSIHIETALKDADSENHQYGKALWRIKTDVMYSNALFEAEFHLFDSGMLQMLDDTPKLAELEVKRDVFRHNWRVQL